MVEISETLTRRVAELARLELSENEVRSFTPQLGRILAYVEQLQAVDVTGVPPLLHPFPIETPLREDVIIPPLEKIDGSPKMLGPGPDIVDGGFKVPPIL